MKSQNSKNPRSGRQAPRLHDPDSLSITLTLIGEQAHLFRAKAMSEEIEPAACLSGLVQEGLDRYLQERAEKSESDSFEPAGVITAEEVV